MSDPPSIRKFAAYREEVRSEAGREADGEPLIRLAVAAVVANPHPGVWQDDVLVNEPASGVICRELVARAKALAGDADIESYGKGVLIGMDGDQEQGVSFVAGTFGDTLRELTGGTEWVSSVTKRTGPGAPIDIPLAHKNVLKARSHYDAVTIAIPDAPAADEIVIVIGMATRSRLNERAKGFTVAEGMGGR
ncbi:MAG: amino acid synthesis family protein [Solirubrobacterales bacterium]|nr:amino acid synthesis family protein [Solirubrobacterales bacterium]